MTGPLAGVRILDISRLLPGPASTWYLHGLGAEVDRVEQLRGDFTRHVPPAVDGAGAIFTTVSRGKRAMTLEMRHPDTPALIERMLANYDVLVEGFKPGVLEAMGLAPGRLLELFPRLVICRLSGYGQTGAWWDRPGHDINYVGMTGAVAAAEGGPYPVQIADVGGALVAAMGIAAALYGVERTGRGRVVDVSLAEAALSLYAPHVVALANEGRAAKPAGEMLSGGLAIYANYECSDGGVITVGALEPKFQAALLREFQGLDHETLTAGFKGKTRDEWVALLPDGCTGPALQPTEMAEHPLHKSRGSVLDDGRRTWIPAPLSEERELEPVPGLGEHTDVILADAGLTLEEIAALRERGAVG
jgi:crotonobetainyl-CoA:carnitine CoA-transferase CaiB-like acyl-CoA transferase